MVLSFTDVTEQVQQALSNITEGVCHPLKVRVEHILAVDAGATVLYSISNLVRFYQQVIGQVGNASPRAIWKEVNTYRCWNSS
jgi:hypothetical protein